MKFTAGSLPWLLSYELRLFWRGVGGARTWVLLGFGGFIWAVLHFVAWGAVRFLVKQGGVLPPQAWVLGGLGTLVVLSLLLATAIARSVSALFERGDMDLLLASPLPAERIFWARGIAIALASMALWFVLLTPFAHMGLVAGRPSLLAIYPVLFALGLGLSAVGMTLTLALVHALGARRARVVAQLLGALVGALFFLGSQFQALLPAATRQALQRGIESMAQPGGLLASDSGLWYPFRALMGEPLPALWVCVLGMGGFWLAVRLTRQSFVSGLQQAQGLAAPAPKARMTGGVAAFNKSFAFNILAKEWKLIARDPNLIAQTLLQVLYLLPIIFAFGHKGGAAAALMPGLVLIAAMLAGSLCWLTVAAEDAPDLLGGAPVPLAQLRWYKVAAALVPVWLLLLPALLGCVWWQPQLLLVLLPCLVGCTLSAGVVLVWFPRQGNRRDLKKRQGAGVVQSLLEFASALGWSASAYVALAHPWWLPLTLAFGVAGPLGAWWGGAQLREG